MTKEKIKKLEAMGFKVATTKDWLQLSVEEEKVIERGSTDGRDARRYAV